MNDVVLIAAGCAGMTIAVVHGYLGGTMVNRALQDAPGPVRRIMQAIMFLSAVYWFVGGAVLAFNGVLFGEEGRQMAALVAGAIFLTAAMANLWATRGRHFGWMVLTATTVLVAVGY